MRRFSLLLVTAMFAFTAISANAQDPALDPTVVLTADQAALTSDLSKALVRKHEAQRRHDVIVPLANAAQAAEAKRVAITAAADKLPGLVRDLVTALVKSGKPIAYDEAPKARRPAPTPLPVDPPADASAPAAAAEPAAPATTPVSSTPAYDSNGQILKELQAEISTLIENTNRICGTNIDPSDTILLGKEYDLENLKGYFAVKAKEAKQKLDKNFGKATTPTEATKEVKDELTAATAQVCLLTTPLTQVITTLGTLPVEPAKPAASFQELLDGKYKPVMAKILCTQFEPAKGKNVAASINVLARQSKSCSEHATLKSLNRLADHVNNLAALPGSDFVTIEYNNDSQQWEAVSPK